MESSHLSLNRNVSLMDSQPQSPLCVIPSDLISDIVLRYLELSQWSSFGPTCQDLNRTLKDPYLWQRKLASVFPNASLKHLGTKYLKQLAQLNGFVSLNCRMCGGGKQKHITQIYKLAMEMYLDPQAPPKLRMPLGKLQQALSSHFSEILSLYLIRSHSGFSDCFQKEGLKGLMTGVYADFPFSREGVALTDKELGEILQFAPPIPSYTVSLEECKRGEACILHYLVNHFNERRTTR